MIINENVLDGYVPQPIDVSDVELPSELMSLAESLAKNVHEVWAQERIAQGWQYGSKRNDELKHHPCIVPYDVLPDSERDFDRNTSLSTLRLIYKLGFKIEKQ